MSESESKTRVQLDLTPKALSALVALNEDTEAASYAEVIRNAKITGTLTADQNAILDGYIASAPAVLERYCGPIELEARTYTSAARSGSLVLPWPYASIVSVSVDGALVEASAYDAVNLAPAGILGPATGYNPWGYGTTVTVIAMVGSANVKPHVKQAALELVTYWWQSMQQGQRGAYIDVNGVPVGFSVPARVIDLLRASPQPPGFG